MCAWYWFRLKAAFLRRSFFISSLSAGGLSDRYLR
jgi:hypothetical protein